MKNWPNKILFLPLVLALLLSSCATTPQHFEAPAVQPAPPPLTQQPRVALVLGSGGAKGYAHLGVLQALEEAHIPVDVLVGSSAGSFVASLYADNQSFKKTYDIMMPAGFWDYADLGNLSGSGGIIQGYQLQSFMLKNMKARNFNQLKKRLIIATSDINTGQLYAIEGGPIAPAVIASSAIPGAVKPVSLYGHTLIDGGIVSPVPVGLAKKLHPKIIIAVDLWTRNSAATPTSALGVMDSAWYIMGKRITDDSLKGADVVISPKVGDASLFDIGKKYKMYLDGLAAARKEIPKIRKLLASK